MILRETKPQDTKYLVDSWVWIEYFKGGPRGPLAQDFIGSGHDVRITPVNIAEVYKFLLEKDKDNSEQFMDFMLKRSFLIQLDEEIAREAGRVRPKEKLGIADSFIPAASKVQEASIVTGDPDFKKFKNVTFIG